MTSVPHSQAVPFSANEDSWVKIRQTCKKDDLALPCPNCKGHRQTGRCSFKTGECSPPRWGPVASVDHRELFCSDSDADDDDDSDAHVVVSKLGRKLMPPERCEPELVVPKTGSKRHRPPAPTAMAAEKTVSELKHKLATANRNLRSTALKMAELSATVKSLRADNGAMKSELSRSSKKARASLMTSHFKRKDVIPDPPCEARSAPCNDFGKGCAEQQRRCFLIHAKAVKQHIEKLAPDPLGQLQLASHVNDKMRGVRDSFHRDNEAWKCMQASLFKFVGSLREATKGRHSNVNRALTQGVCAAVANQVPNGKLKLVADETGFRWHQLKKARDRWKRWCAGEEKELVELRGAVRKDKISEEWVDFAVSVWNDHTRKSERKKDSVRNPHNKADKTLHRIHWLEMTRAEMSQLITKLGKEKCGDEFHFSSWCVMKVRPFYVKPVGRDVVQCVHCLRFSLMVESLYQHRQRNRNVKACDCKFTLHKNDREFRRSLVCPREAGQHFDEMNCTLQKCRECKDLRLFSVCEEVEQNDAMDHLAITWERHEKMECKTKDGQVKDKKDFVKMKKGSMREFMQHFKEHWPKFLIHCDTGKWQSSEALLFKRPPRGVVGGVQDFSENLSMEPKREHQSRCHSQVSVTMCGAMFCMNVDDLKTVAETERTKLRQHFARHGKPAVVKELHVIVSPDLNHDNAFVQHANDHVFTPYLKENVDGLKKIANMSDGAPSQCKCSTHALWVSSHQHRTGILAVWCFRGTAHGKDEVDGGCGDCKNAIGREQLKAERGETSRVKSSVEVFEFLRDNFVKFSKDFYDEKGAGVHRRVFHCLPAHGEGSVNRNIRGCETLNGMKKLHQLIDVGQPGRLRVRTRSCHSCDGCWADGKNCRNDERCGKPWIVVLKPKAHRQLVESLDNIAAKGEETARKVKPNDVTCVMVRKEHEPWMLGKVHGDMGAHEVKTPIDTEHAVLVPGDLAVEVRKLHPVNPGTKVFDIVGGAFPVRAKDIRLGDIPVTCQQVRRSGRSRGWAVRNQSAERCEIASDTHGEILKSALH